MYEPSRVEKLIVFGAPHPALWRKYLIEDRNRDQFGKSWYVFAFAAIPHLAESFFRGEIFGLGGGLLKQYDTTLRGPDTGVRDRSTITDHDLQVYADSLNQHPKALQSSFRYYGALFEQGQALDTADDLALLATTSFGVHKLQLGVLVPPNDTSIKVTFPEVTLPTMVVMPEVDGYNDVELFADSEALQKLASNVKVERLPNRAHWVLEESRDEVTQHILDFSR
jgi:pimeloyl-ACP methyl ester carboxylesterase